jgi:membrane protease YdiL (CAAX protease family)
MQLVRARKVIVFLALAYGLAWTLGFSFFALGGHLNSGAFVAMAVIYMFTPATAAIITQRVIWKEPWRDFGLKMPRVLWLIAGWLWPVLLVILGLGLSLLVQGVSLVSGLEGFLGNLAGKIPPDKIAEIHRQLEHSFLAKPGVLLLISLVQVFIAGPTVNAGAAFGEELGWRGFLLHELNPLGFWRSSFVIGFFWGLWHLPLIVNGYNYPDHPFAGPLMMIVLTILLSPLMGYLRLRAESVFPVAIFHGTFNAAATLVIFLHGGTVLLTGMTGAAGLLTLFLADLILWLHLRRSPAILD